jgi:hypothetical protein
MNAEQQVSPRWQGDRVFAVLAMLITGTLALEAVFARWLPPGSALDGVAQWAALLGCAWLSAAVANKSGRGRFLGPLVFILLVILLFCGTLFLECLVRPTGCDV